MTTHDSTDDDDAGRPSRSARRRDALDVLALARQLSELPPAQIAKLDLPDDVREELANVRRTPSHVAHKRELAYLAKRMRAHGDDAFARARAALANNRAAGARETAALHRIEIRREELLGKDGDTTLAAFITAHPGIDHQRLRALIRRARHERDAGTPPRAQRELVRLLRDMDERQNNLTTD